MNELIYAEAKLVSNKIDITKGMWTEVQKLGGKREKKTNKEAVKTSKTN